jgi:hypothetical protein
MVITYFLFPQQSLKQIGSPSFYQSQALVDPRRIPEPGLEVCARRFPRRGHTANIELPGFLEPACPYVCQTLCRLGPSP